MPLNQSIDTREELIHALTEAAELEHTLLIQYLFAAFSAKKRLDEGLNPLQQAEVNSWQRTILEVARQEMGHLGLVCNLLSAIGGAPRFGRPNFPQSAQKYYSLEADFTLSKLSSQTLRRFVSFELPTELTDEECAELGLSSTSSRCSAAAPNSTVPDSAAPDPLSYNRVGDLYSQIATAFTIIPEKDLFIGPRYAQDTGGWSEKLNLQLITNQQSARKAISDIIFEGEGVTSAGKDSHYIKFKIIWKTLQEIEAKKEFEPARNVVDNPFTRRHRDSDASKRVNLIKNPLTLQVAELFNSIYSTMLLILMQYYAYNGESSEQRTFLRNTLSQLMSGVLRPLGEMLTELPLSDRKEDGFAGPGFEIYSDLRLSPYPENRWTILKERFSHAATQINSLVIPPELEALQPRITMTAQNIGWILQNLDVAITNVR